MSDHPKEAKRNLKRIFICDDIYLDVFRLLAPVKVGLELALVSDTFDAIVDTHFKYRKWTLGKFGTSEKIFFKLNNGGPEKVLPSPQKPLPNSIVGFAWAWICGVIDSDAIDFLKCIGHLLESNVFLHLDIEGKKKWKNFATFGWPLLNVPAIIKMRFKSPTGFRHFRRFISPTILRDCINLRFFFAYDEFLQFPPDDSKGSSEGQAICKWLHTPRADGEPKVLSIGHAIGKEFPVDALKTTFLNAVTSVSFIIGLSSVPYDVGPFVLLNSLTREQLKFRKIGKDDYNNVWWLIKRSPIDKSGQKWTELEKEAMDDGKNDWKMETIKC